MPFLLSKFPSYAFKNMGDYRFQNVAELTGDLDEPSFSNGAAYGDLDNDGDLGSGSKQC